MRNLNKALIVIAVAAVLVDAAWHGLHSFSQAVDRGVARRLAADGRSIVTALEEHKKATGTYPAAMTAGGLAQALSPKYMRKVHTEQVRYFSDGRNYMLFIWPVGSGAYHWPYGPIEIRDGVFTSWPEWLNLDGPGRLDGASQRPDTRSSGV